MNIETNVTFVYPVAATVLTWHGLLANEQTVQLNLNLSDINVHPSLFYKWLDPSTGT